MPNPQIFTACLFIQDTAQACRLAGCYERLPRRGWLRLPGTEPRSLRQCQRLLRTLLVASGSACLRFRCPAESCAAPGSWMLWSMYGTRSSTSLIRQSGAPSHPCVGSSSSWSYRRQAMPPNLPGSPGCFPCAQHANLTVLMLGHMGHVQAQHAVDVVLARQHMPCASRTRFRQCMPPRGFSEMCNPA